MPYYWPSGAPPPMAKILMKKKISGHLAATALMRIFGIRRRRACLGMPTDGGRRNTMWRCTNDRQRGCKMFMGLTTVEKRKIKTLKTLY